MTVGDALASNDVVAGTVKINFLNAYVMFDSGATKFFISHELLDN